MDQSDLQDSMIVKAIMHSVAAYRCCNGMLKLKESSIEFYTVERIVNG